MQNRSPERGNGKAHQLPKSYLSFHKLTCKNIFKGIYAGAGKSMSQTVLLPKAYGAIQSACEAFFK
jgi:hypothetical protein